MTLRETQKLAQSLWDVGPPPPCPERFNLAAHALWAGQPDAAAALIVAGADGAARETWSYARLREAVARAAGGLRAAGLAPGDRVMLRLGSTSDFPVLYLAAIAAGGVAAPVSAMLTPREAGVLARDLDARLICLGEGLAVDAPEGATVLAGDVLARLRRGPEVGPADAAADDLAYIVYTSGSSGRPKGVAHAHRAAWARRMMWRDWYGLTADDVMLHAGAFNWTFTLGTGLLDPWGAGATAVVYDGPRDPGVWARIARAQGATLFAAAPGVVRQLLKYGADVGAAFATLRHGLVAGEKTPDALAEAWRAATGKPLFEALGMSELSTYASAGPGAPPRPGRIGPPQRGRRVAVLRPGTETPAPVGEPGELAVARDDPGLMLGYWRDPEATAAAMRGAWFVTGDRAAMDADGWLAHLGRADDLMNAGGFRVAPQEVEAAISACPGVAEVAAAEVTVAGGVTLIGACVVPTDAAAGLDAARLEAWCAERLAQYKRPRLYALVDALPRTAAGKVLRRAVAERLAGNGGASG
ncbi:class I adenylate-forming enzyme family protein [Rubrimonas cliftonensis]|uniref:Acyl-coenzyme A synthetase/AMP-(Fatty) acid ligase n=1 Tax=Rubrimonas cliftonensis TaxID=89524 RepID=A0A1H3W509_9RHOB|nr:class I adenylate-forming enzyme family protein [Rubrimonas cliftonensis]SDZ82195.1 Acyl-coenzyme A synthetase/AMP-(fatty) acid ligase [Rubrimonas cliftonensis]